MIQKVLVAFFILLLAAFVAAFLSLNFLVKKAVNTVGPRIMKVDVRLAASNISPLSGSGSLLHLQISNPDGYKDPYALLFGGVQIKTQRDSLFASPVIVEEIAIRNPEINIEGLPFSNNLIKLLSNLNASSQNSDAAGKNASLSDGKKSRKVIAQNIFITGAKLHVHLSTADQSLDQTLVLPDIILHNVGSEDEGVTLTELSRQILTPLLESAITEGDAALAKQGIKQLEKQGVDQLNKVLGNFLK